MSQLPDDTAPVTEWERRQLLAEVQRLRRRCLELAEALDQKESPYVQQISSHYEPEIARLKKLVEKLEKKTKNKIHIPVPGALRKIYNKIHKQIVKWGPVR